MITYDEVKAACESVDAEYREEILPLIRNFHSTWAELHSPYRNNQIRALADTHGQKNLVAEPGFDFHGFHLLGKMAKYIPDCAIGLENWFQCKSKSSGFRLWNYLICGHVGLPPVSNLISCLKTVKEHFRIIRAEYAIFVKKLPLLANEVESHLAILKRTEDAEDAEFRAMFPKKRPSRKTIRVRVVFEEA